MADDTLRMHFQVVLYFAETGTRKTVVFIIHTTVAVRIMNGIKIIPLSHCHHHLIDRKACNRFFWVPSEMKGGNHSDHEKMNGAKIIPLFDCHHHPIDRNNIRYSDCWFLPYKSQ